MNNTLVKLSTALVVILVFLSGCATPSPTLAPTPASPVYWPTDGWRSSTPEEQGMDSLKLADMADQIQSEKLDLNSLLIVRNGYLVSELYVYPYSVEQAHDAFSVTKSVISALVGIAIQKGLIKDVNQSIFSLLSTEGVANLDSEKKAITIENLLTQTSGLDCDDNSATTGVGAMMSSENWVNFVLSQPMVAQPGQKFNYCTSAIQVLSAVIQQATGMSGREFANQYLFAPLGIGPIPLERWPSDPQGVTIGGYGLILTPQDMAKFGLLYLNNGQWDGQTIVSADWVSTSTTRHSNLADKKEYGYLWWIDPDGAWYAALGRGGQHIFVYPSKNLVVTFTASLPYANDADLIPLQELIDQYILPSIKSDQPLSANPQGLAHLKASLQALSEPQPVTPAPLPAIAAQISGKTYTFGDNPLGWQSIIFSFQDGTAEAKVTLNGVRLLTIGLDNIYRKYDIDNKIFPEMLRGIWETPDTFVVEDLQLGRVFKVVFRIQFSGSALMVTGEEVYSGMQFSFQGESSQ
jgi:CubicO group peptidase (beta-lactamase class C family)